MRKHTIRFIVALITFSVGVGVFLLCGHLRAAEAVPAPRLRPAIPEGWKKVEAEGKFSFYLPPDMSTADFLCYPSGWDRGDFLANQSLTLDYGYGKRRSCERLLGRSEEATLQTLNLEVDGRAATLHRSAEGNRSRMHLCFPDVGDGKTALSLLVGYEDKRGADVARRIFETVEFK